MSWKHSPKAFLRQAGCAEKGSVWLLQKATPLDRLKKFFQGVSKNVAWDNLVDKKIQDFKKDFPGPPEQNFRSWADFVIMG